MKACFKLFSFEKKLEIFPLVLYGKERCNLEDAILHDLLEEILYHKKNIPMNKKFCCAATYNLKYLKKINELIEDVKSDV